MEQYDRSYILFQYVKKVRESKAECSECKKEYFKIIPAKLYPKPENSTSCNDCWTRTHLVVANFLWKKINDYKPEKCEICHTEKKHNPDKFYWYSDENIFGSQKDVSQLVSERAEWSVIQKKLDESRVFCEDCHVLVKNILPDLHP